MRLHLLPLSFSFTFSLHSCSRSLLLTRTFFISCSFLHKSSNSTIDRLQKNVSWNTCSLDFSYSASKSSSSTEKQFSFLLEPSAIFISLKAIARALFSNLLTLIVDWSKYGKYLALIGSSTLPQKSPLTTKIDVAGAWDWKQKEHGGAN